jgi:ubiquitin carboxyl-terminal hydrolase 4/11/15
LWSAPPVLVIHLKRFEQTANGRARKLETNVLFPDEFDIGRFFVGPKQQTRYRLFAVDEHVGCINSGHYLARAYCSSRECWYRFSDSVIEPCHLPSVHSQNAYVLFYERIGQTERMFPELQFIPNVTIVSSDDSD